jgi:hypothetical protein
MNVPMLRLTAAQEELMRELGWRAFADEMVIHLGRFAPEHCRVIGEDNVRRAIALGIERGRKYGFTYRGPLRFYLELMFMFGSDFDTDPQFPEWGRDLLGGGDEDDQLYRAERIHEQLADFYERVIGSDRGLALQALRRTLELARGPLPFGDDELVPGLAWSMQQLYPQKHAYLGEAAHAALVDEALQLAEARGLRSTRGRTTLCLLMSMIGHGALHDPLYPWVAVPLRDHVPAHKRERRLERRVLIYLERTITNLGDRRG